MTKVNRIILCIAGGDGSLIGTLKAAKDHGVDIDQLPAVALPYGTGNDLARVTNWGGTPSGKIYKDVYSIVRELCENAVVKDFNVWNVQVKFKDGGNVFEYNSKTKKVEARDKAHFERDMINYFGIGEDGRIGFAVEKRRTANRCCNKCLYFLYGVEFIVCPREDPIGNLIEYVKRDPEAAANTGLE